MALAPTPPRYGTAEAARLVGRDEATLRQAIAAKRLRAQQQDGRWSISADDLLAWDAAAPRYRSTKVPAYERAWEVLAEYPSTSAEELALLLDIHPGNARKYLAILAKQDRVTRLANGEWAPTPNPGTQPAAHAAA